MHPKSTGAFKRKGGKMIEAALGIIDKMRIEVYDSNDFTTMPKKTIYVQINPDRYTMKYAVNFNEEQPQNASSSNLQYNNSTGEEVAFEFLFDSSGIVPPAKIKDGKGLITPLEQAADIAASLKPALVNPFAEVQTVEEQVTEFKSLLIGYNGETHQTAFLQLIWGAYTLQCRVKSMDIEYTLFRKDGRPIRAKVKCVFKDTVSHQVMVQKQDKSSPDMTHERTVHMNDRLTLMAEDIYKSNQYYIDIAKHNHLLTFRKLETGSKLFFPPIK